MHFNLAKLKRISNINRHILSITNLDKLTYDTDYRLFTTAVKTYYKISNELYPNYLNVFCYSPVSTRSKLIHQPISKNISRKSHRFWCVLIANHLGSANINIYDKLYSILNNLDQISFSKLMSLQF